MADEYDVIVCGAGSAGGFLAGEVAPYGSVLLLDAGPHLGGAPQPTVGSPERRRFATQINLGKYLPDGPGRTQGDAFFAHKAFLNQANPLQQSVQREPRIVGGGSFVNTAAWLRPRRSDWEGFARETGVAGWTREAFEPYFLKAEKLLYVHRNRRDDWNRASRLYEQAALALGIPVIETASNRHNCLRCGHCLDLGMPCKYDGRMSTTNTQIPRALASGATLVDNATVVRVEISNRRAIGVTYLRAGRRATVRARKLVVVSAGAIGTPALLRSSGIFDLNRNVGRYLRAHPHVSLDVQMPEADGWDADRGYQWNCHHFLATDNGEPGDVLIHLSAGLAANTPWLAAAVGGFGQPYKDLMRKFRARVGASLFEVRAGVQGRVAGEATNPVVLYPILDTTGKPEPKTRADLVAAIRQVGAIYRSIGAISTIPNGNDPQFVLEGTLGQILSITGGSQPLGSCRAAADRSRGVVNSDLMSFDVENLMCCDASVIPADIGASPMATVMAIAGRAAEFVVTQVLGKTLKPADRAESLLREEVKR